MDPVLMRGIMQAIILGVRTFKEVKGRMPEGEELEALVNSFKENSELMVQLADTNARKAIEEARNK